MDETVDLTNLRSMTDGDAELEKTLFEEFMISFEKGIKGLHESCGENMAETWRKHSHALKGIALNLGAGKLGELCKKAQDDHLAAAGAKDSILRSIEEEYKVVKVFLQKAA